MKIITQRTIANRINDNMKHVRLSKLHVIGSHSSDATSCLITSPNAGFHNETTDNVSRDLYLIICKRSVSFAFNDSRSAEMSGMWKNVRR